jgi:hypothetical protein
LCIIWWIFGIFKQALQQRRDGHEGSPDHKSLDQAMQTIPQSCAVAIDTLGSDKDRRSAGSASLHRLRSRLISERTAVINQISGFLFEHGIPVRQGLRGRAGRWRFAPLMRPLEL